MNQCSDEQLVRESRQGNEDAFAALYRRYEVRLLRYLLHLCQTKETAEDLFQETLLEVVRAERVPCDGGNLAPWLFTVARNKFLNRTRAEKRYHAALAQAGAPEACVPDAETVMSAHQEQARRAAAFDDAVRCLPEALREVYSMRLAGLTLEDIGRVLGIPIGTVKSRLNRVLQRLKEGMT